MASTLDELLKASTEAQRVLEADLHSISIPLPKEHPTHFRIILSTDEEAARIVGLEFPINKGLAGWVYQYRRPSVKNVLEQDSRHFDIIDKATGTYTGYGAMLTLPLLSGNHCHGVIQFMKIQGGDFDDTDVRLASQFLPGITELVAALDETGESDPAKQFP